MFDSVDMVTKEVVDAVQLALTAIEKEFLKRANELELLARKGNDIANTMPVNQESIELRTTNLAFSSKCVAYLDAVNYIKERRLDCLVWYLALLKEKESGKNESG